MNHPAFPTLADRPLPRARGFTLIEVMITVAIVAILAAVALPAYTAYLRRGDLTTGFTGLTSYRVTLEQYYQDNRSYANGTACGATAPTVNHFSLSCATTTNGYTITATGNGSRTTGYIYTVNEANTRTTTRFAGATVSKSCWLLKGNEC